MSDILNFKTDPERAMAMLKHGLSHAVKITRTEMEAMVERDNAERDQERMQSGQMRRGPKPRREATKPQLTS